MSNLHVTKDERHLAVSGDGEEVREVLRHEQCPPGWHLMTTAEYESWIEKVADSVVRDVVNERMRDPATRAEYRAEYLDALRRTMAERVDLVRDGVGATIFGYRFWCVQRDSQDELRAIFDGLTAFTKRHETYAFLIEDDASGGDDDWTEAWRVSDRTLARAGRFRDVMNALVLIHRPRMRG
jgi:hypothetical protein